MLNAIKKLFSAGDGSRAVVKKNYLDKAGTQKLVAKIKEMCIAKSDFGYWSDTEVAE